MSRNGSGVYSLPGTYAAVSGETIEAQQHNDPLEDLQSDANTARPIVAGGTGATTAAAARSGLAVPGTGTVNTFAKTQTWSKGADVASANALTLGTDGNYFDITGTTAITSIGTLGIGTVVKLHFDGVLTLTYDATALILPGAADITTAAGDEAEFIEYDTGDWRCTSYQPASSRPQAIHPPSKSFSNLYIKVTGNTGATIAADAITVTDGSGGYQTLAFNNSVDFSTTGAGALDAGTIASGTWYAIWAIAKADGTTSAIASTSGTAPTMPSGYTYKARMGWVVTSDGSAQLMGTWQWGRTAQYVIGLAQTTVSRNIAHGIAGTFSLTSPSLANVSISSVVPTTASEIRISATNVYGGATNASVAVAPNSSWGGSNNGPEGSSGNIYPVFLLNSTANSCSASLLLEATTISWASSTAGGGIACLGWVDNL